METSLTHYLRGRKKAFRALGFSPIRSGKGLFYFILSLLGYLSLVFAPFFILSNWEAARNVKKDGKLKIIDSFQVYEKKGKLTKTYQLFILGFFFLVAGVGIILGMMYLLNIIFILVDTLSAFRFDVVILITQIVAYLLIAIYTFLVFTYFSGASYLIYNEEEISLRNALKESFATLKGKEKFGVLWMGLLNLLEIGVFFLVIYALAGLLASLRYKSGIISITYLIGGLIILFRLVELSLAIVVSLHSFYEERLFGVSSSEVSERVTKLDRKQKEANLLALFDHVHTEKATA